VRYACSGDKAVQIVQLITHLHLMLKLWHLHSLTRIHVCAWDFPLPLRILQPTIGHLLGKFYSCPFSLNINFTAVLTLQYFFSKKNFCKRSVRNTSFPRPDLKLKERQLRLLFKQYYNCCYLKFSASVLVQLVSLLAMHLHYVGLRLS